YFLPLVPFVVLLAALFGSWVQRTFNTRILGASILAFYALPTIPVATTLYLTYVDGVSRPYAEPFEALRDRIADVEGQAGQFYSFREPLALSVNVDLGIPAPTRWFYIYNEYERIRDYNHGNDPVAQVLEDLETAQTKYVLDNSHRRPLPRRLQSTWDAYLQAHYSQVLRMRPYGILWQRDMPHGESTDRSVTMREDAELDLDAHEPGGATTTIFVAGHAYGAHGGQNEALYPELLDRFDWVTPGSALVLTGDFLRECRSPGAWQLLERQLAQTSVLTYLVRGNHERWPGCEQRLSARHGQSFYAFDHGEALHIVLDSQKDAHVFGPDQIALIEQTLATHRTGDPVFLYMHHLVWLADGIRYPEVRANPGSRHAELQNSNYWRTLHPLLVGRPDIRFYLVAGDVAGRPGTIARFLDSVENVTFVAAGMGEVPDGNLLKIAARGSAVEFEWLPLQPPVLPGHPRGASQVLAAAPPTTPGGMRPWRLGGLLLGGLLLGGLLLWPYPWPRGDKPQKQESSDPAAGPIPTSSGPTHGRRRVLLLAALAAAVALYLALAAGTSPAPPPASDPDPASAPLSSKFERVAINMSEEAFATFEQDRDAAVADGVRVSSKNTWVRATLHAGGATSQIKLRLRGAFPDHWRSPTKWSFSVKVIDGPLYHGMKRFAFLHPVSRPFLVEHLFLAALGEEGLIALRMEHIQLTLNGNERGLYLLLERPGKRLIEHNRRREGPLFRLNKDAWLHYRSQGIRPPPAQAFDATFVEAEQRRSVTKTSEAHTLYQTGASLLHGFNVGELPPSQVFDIDAFAKAAALVAAFGSYELDWKDLVFYYNPVTSRIEPIAKEIHPSTDLITDGWWRNRERSPDRKTFVRRLFADNAFAEAYVAHLWKFTSPEYMPGLWARHAEDIERLTEIIRSEYPAYAPQPQAFETIRRIIRGHLLSPTPLHAYREQTSEDVVGVEIVNFHFFPLELTCLRTHERVVATPVGPGKLSPATGDDDATSSRRMMFRFQDRADAANPRLRLQLEFKYTGTGEKGRVSLAPWSRTTRIPDIGSPLDAIPSAALGAFFDINEETKIITCHPRDLAFEETIILPAGFVVRCTGPFTWSLGRGVSLISHSPLQLRGVEPQPFRITSTATDPGGVAVIQAVGKSRLERVLVSNLGQPRLGSWALSGALSFYESDIDIFESQFEGNRSGDDLLNIVRSQVHINRAVFAESFADALDLDFSHGTITNTRFVNAGNDALDISGSELLLRAIHIENAGDKGISVGEASHVHVTGLQIRAAHTGVASKDLSEVTLEEVTIEDAQVGIAAFEKKREFGPAAVRGSRIEFFRVQTHTDARQGSTISLQHHALPPSRTPWIRPTTRLRGGPSTPSTP
ncbi:MAG: CotH kinase family protein, partial [Nannocystaceae bacterium]